MNFISHRFIYLEGASHSRRRGRRLMDGQGGGGGTELHHMISKEKSDIMNATENGVKAVLGEADRKSAKGPKKIKGVRNELEERLIKAGVFAEQALDEKHHDAHAALYHHTYRDSVEDVKDAPYHVITQMQKGLAVAEKELTKSLNSKLKLSESNRETKRLDQRKESISTVISEKKELYKAGETIAKERLNTLERNASSYLLLPNGKVQGQEQLDQIYEIILRDADAFLKGKSIRLDIPDMKVKKINKKLLKEIFGEDMTRTQIMDFLLWNQGSKKPSAENRIIGSNKDNPKVENQYKREVGSIKKRRDIFDTHLNQEGTKGSASRLFNLFRNGTIAAGTSTVTAKKSEIIQGVKEINWGKEEIFPKEIQEAYEYVAAPQNEIPGLYINLEFFILNLCSWVSVT